MKEYEKPYLKITVWEADGIFCNRSMEDLQTGSSVNADDGDFAD